MKEPTYKIFAPINNAAHSCQAALDPAVRMALTPNGVVQNNCFEKTLLCNCPFQIAVSISHSTSDVKMFLKDLPKKLPKYREKTSNRRTLPHPAAFLPFP